jgi:hypothetical protein
MPQTCRREACSAINAFRIDRALQRFCLPRPLLSRSLFLTRPCQTQLQTQPGGDKSNPAHLSADLDRQKALEILSKTLSALRIKNRGVDSTIFRKVGAKSDLYYYQSFPLDESEKELKPQRKLHRGAKHSRLFKPATSPEPKTLPPRTPSREFRLGKPVFAHLFDGSVPEKSLRSHRVFPERTQHLKNTSKSFDYDGRPVCPKLDNLKGNGQFSVPWIQRDDPRQVGMRGLRR